MGRRKRQNGVRRVQEMVGDTRNGLAHPFKKAQKDVFRGSICQGDIVKGWKRACTYGRFLNLNTWTGVICVIQRNEPRRAKPTLTFAFLYPPSSFGLPSVPRANIWSTCAFVPGA